MIRETRFVLSHAPYAVALPSFRVEPYDILRDAAMSRIELPAVWYRRKAKTTYACTGYLWSIVRTENAPSDVAEFLAGFTDGRYGGVCEGRWDGKRYWGAQEPKVIDAHLALLTQMLADYPAVPVDYDGWWTFKVPR